MPEVTPIPAELADEVRRTLRDLRSVKLAAQAWAVVAGDVARLDAAVERGDEPAVRAALLPVSQAAFEGKVRGRFAGTGTHVPAVVPTKRSVALPIVGLVCAAIILGLGYALGGVPLLAASAVFAVFVFSVAYAGTRVAARRSDKAKAKRGRIAPTGEPVYPPPRALRDATERIESVLT